MEELVTKARLRWEESHDAETEEMMLPLIRLRVSLQLHIITPTDPKVETTGAKEMTNPVRFGQDYIGRVANPRDILQYFRKKAGPSKSKSHLLSASC